MSSQTATKIDFARPLGLIAGNGQFPLDVARSAREKKIRIVAIAHQGETNKELAELVDSCDWVRAGQLGRIIKLFRKCGVNQAVFAGGLSRLRLFKGLTPDLKAIMLMARLKSLRDDVVLRAVADELEKNGIQVFSACDILTECIPASGILTRRALMENELADALIGWECARGIGRLDIGQTVIVNQKTVVAVEAVEGTDKAIQRAGDFSGKGATVVKLCKPQQDTRIDLPAIGEKTIRTMKAAGASALVIEAGRSLILNPIEVVRLANEENIAIIAVASEQELQSIGEQ